ncbi:MAG: zinc-binding dehydrogenase [Pirellulaceae bacterium]
MVPSRLEFCRRVYGVPHTIHFTGDGSELEKMLQITGGDKYVVVSDATGNQHSMSSALQYVSHSGSLVFVGITTGEVTFKHPLLHKPEMSLKGSRMPCPPTSRGSLDSLKTGRSTRSLGSRIAPRSIP